nr:protein Daple-like [Ipomoea batatas]
MQPNDNASLPAQAAPPSAASPRSLRASPPQDIPPRSLTPNEPMGISPPNTGFGTFGITRSPFTPMQTMPTIMDTLSRTTRPPSSSHTSLPFSTQGRSLDPTVPHGVRSKLTQPELNSLDEWLGEGVQMMVPRDLQNMVEPPDNRVMAVHYHAIQGGLQFPPHPLTLAFLASHNIAPCQLTPNEHRAGPSSTFNPYPAGYGFSTAWVQFVVPFAAPSYEGLDADRAKLCGDGPHDHRRYHDPLLVNQLSGGPPLPPVSSTPSMLRVYNTRSKPTPSHTQSDDEESSVDVMAGPTLDGVESGVLFSPSRAAPPVIALDSPARVDRPFGPPRSPSIEYDPHDPLFARGHSGTSRPMPLRPYHPDHIDFIRRVVREMQSYGRLEFTFGGGFDECHRASTAFAGGFPGLCCLGRGASGTRITPSRSSTHTNLQLAHSTLQGEHEEQQVTHAHALERAKAHAIEDWQGTEDFSCAADGYACSRMPGLLRYWLSSPERSGQAMVDAMSGWHDAHDYQAYMGPPLVQVLQEWAITAGGKSAMGPVAEVWLRDTDEGHARVVRECEAAFYLGQRDMQDQLYGKLRRRFTSFSIAGWKLPEYLPLRRPPAPAMPTSTTTLADGFLMSPERAGGTSSVALPSDPAGGSGAIGSVDPSASLHFTSGSGFFGSAAVLRVFPVVVRLLAPGSSERPRGGLCGLSLAGRLGVGSVDPSGSPSLWFSRMARVCLPCLAPLILPPFLSAYMRPWGFCGRWFARPSFWFPWRRVNGQCGCPLARSVTRLDGGQWMWVLLASSVPVHVDARRLRLGCLRLPAVSVIVAQGVMR